VEKGYKMPRVTPRDRVVVATTNLEQAELKRDQIQASARNAAHPALQGLDVRDR
jgi:hypothetical protein